MAVVFLEGFDKYGGVNTSPGAVQALLQAEWTAVTASGALIVAGLSATGFAVSIVGGPGTLSKTLPSNYSRLIGGVRFSVTSFAQASGIQFTDLVTNQCGICINQTTGTFAVKNGSYLSGTILGTPSIASISAGTTHYLEWDITFSNSGSYQLWLDGVSILSGSGDTTGSANSYANSVSLNSANSAVIPIFDDFYLFDATGTTNNAVLLNSPRIETTFPTSDSAVQFAAGAGILGSSVARTPAGASSPAANTLYLRRFIPAASCTLNSISFLPGTNSGSSNWRGVVYADSGGAAGTLMSSGSTITGVTNGVTQTLPLTTPQSLVAGTPYWVGVNNDTAIVISLFDASATGYRANATFASGAPSTAPAMTAGQPTFLMWGNTSAGAANFVAVNQQPPAGQYSYVYDSTVNHEDLYAFNTLSAPVVHSVAVKAYAQKSDSGARTVSMRMKSGSTDSGGSLTGQALGTSFGWLGSYFPTDPNTSAAWTLANLNAAVSGFKIDS